MQISINWLVSASKDIDNLKFSGSFLMKCVFLSLTSEWSNTSAYTASMEIESFHDGKVGSNGTQANSSKYDLLCAVPSQRKEWQNLQFPFLEEVIAHWNQPSPMSLLIWPEELKYSVDAYVRKEINRSAKGYLVLPTVVYACYLLSKVYFAFGEKDSYSRTMQKFEEVCKIFEAGSTVLNSLLHYARELSMQEPTAREIGNNKARFTEILVSRDQIFSQIFNYGQEALFEMWQSYLDVHCDNFFKGLDIRKGIDIILTSMDDYRQSDDCYECKMKEL